MLELCIFVSKNVLFSNAVCLLVNEKAPVYYKGSLGSPQTCLSEQNVKENYLSAL